jgi:hypothetical protein
MGPDGPGESSRGRQMATVDYIHHLAFPKLRDAEAEHLA